MKFVVAATEEYFISYSSIMNCLNADVHDDLKNMGQNISYCPFCDEQLEIHTTKIEPCCENQY